VFFFGCRLGSVTTGQYAPAARATPACAILHDGPAPVAIIAQPLHEACAPVSEWVV
jgi:hypothetical protein